MRRFNFTLALTLVAFSLFCNTYNIDINGTMDFTSIQEAINYASDGDSLIVYPGMYYENLDFLSKSLTLASSYIFTEEDTIINNTIIDGNHEGRCILIENCDDVTVLGFTIVNGINQENFEGGGAIYNHNSTIKIESCILSNNQAILGGALFNRSGNFYLYNNTFHNNYAVLEGGAIGSCQSANKTIYFDSEKKNNIFLNYSANGADIAIVHNQLIETIYIDTFTVINPDRFYIDVCPNINVEIQNEKIVLRQHDLYVSPDGSDSNNGLTAESPLKTISWAQTLIHSDSLNPYTIHLSDGVYSPSSNGEKFPFNTKNHVTILGESTTNTILNAELNSTFILSMLNFNKRYIDIKNLTFTSGSSPNIYASCIDLRSTISDLKLTNCNIIDCVGNTNVIDASEGHHIFENCYFYNNTGMKVMTINSANLECNPQISLNIRNCIFDYNHPFSDPGGFSDGGAISFGGLYTGVGEYNCAIINSQFNRNRNIYWDGNNGGVSCVIIDNFVNADIINCTFADNIVNHSNGGTILVDGSSTINIWNSILYGNDYNSLTLWDENSTINLHYSLLEGGEDNIYYQENGVVNWFGDNLFEDPFFIESGLNEYHLLNSSPCIDSGTLDLPDNIELPDYDLDGNPRVYGEIIDMGCYEWQGTDNTNDELPITDYELSNYPNPFNPETYVEFSILADSEVLLSIYNIKGQLVKTLLDSNITKGPHRIIWDGKNESGQNVSSGIYYCRLKSDKQESIIKMILIK